MTDTTIIEGDEVEWTNCKRTWRGEALRIGTIHTLVRPIDPVGSVNWIETARLTKVAREAVQGG